MIFHEMTLTHGEVLTVLCALNDVMRLATTDKSRMNALALRLKIIRMTGYREEEETQEMEVKEEV